MIKFIVSCCLLFLCVDASWGATQASTVKEGNFLYFDGDYEEAIVKYNQALERASESDIINFDIGTAYYQNEDYPSAISHLQKSLLSEDFQLQEKAHYNLGNSYYKAGIGQEDENIDVAISSLEQSLEHIKTVLNNEIKDMDAEYNYKFVAKELKRLQEKKLKQKQQSQGQKSEENQEEKNKESQEQQEGQKQEGQKGQEEKVSQSEQKDGKDQEGGEGQEEQSGQEGQEGEETQDEGSKASNEGDEAGSKQKSTQGQEQTDTSEDSQMKNVLSQKEVQMLLERYQQNEEPRGLLNFMKHKGKGVTVLKDW